MSHFIVASMHPSRGKMGGGTHNPSILSPADLIKDGEVGPEARLDVPPDLVHRVRLLVPELVAASDITDQKTGMVVMIG
jgi:hypothetical protein